MHLSETTCKYLEHLGQGHLLEIWKSLCYEAQNTLLQDISELDLRALSDIQEKINRYIREVKPDEHTHTDKKVGFISPGSWPYSPLRDEDFLSLEHVPAGSDSSETPLADAYMRSGKLALVLLAGGMGTRLGHSEPKGIFPISPVTGKTLFSLHCEKIQVLCEKYGVDIRLYIMTSSATDKSTAVYMDQQHYFHLHPESVVQFRQGEMPAFSPQTGKILIGEPGRLCLAPDGHGGVIQALDKSGALQDMQAHGVDSVMTFHVDNPLVPFHDMRILEHHIRTSSEMTSLAVRKEEKSEKLGNIVREDTSDVRLSVVEYSEMPLEQAGAMQGTELRYWLGSIGVHVLKIDFIHRILERLSEEPALLPWHLPIKTVMSCSEREGASMSKLLVGVKAFKPERFLFDILPYARNPQVIVVNREECFTALKDDPELVMRHLSRLHHHWLESAGADVDVDALVEISAQYAMTVSEVRKKLAPGTVLKGKKIYLC